MLEITAIENCSFQRGDRVVVALGFFDGIHQAHQRLIEECKTRAQSRDGRSVLFTFQNHPSSVLTPESPTPLLTPYPLKRQILQASGIDVLLAVPFDEALCHTPAQSFVEKVLIERLSAQELVVGFNFRFGYRREGSSDLLQSYVPESFDSVTVIEQQFHEEIPISSSHLRQAILAGNLEETHALLGRPYLVAGRVIAGDGRGRTIGIPTANLKTDEQVLPPNGVYGVRVRFDTLDAEPLLGVMNIGEIPTFTDRSQRTAEVHILDFQGDIYGRYIILELMEFLRNERKFSGPDPLIQQIQTDIRTFRSHVDGE